MSWDENSRPIQPGADDKLQYSGRYILRAKKVKVEDPKNDKLRMLVVYDVVNDITPDRPEPSLQIGKIHFERFFMSANPNATKRFLDIFYFCKVLDPGVLITKINNTGNPVVDYIWNMAYIQKILGKPFEAVLEKETYEGMDYVRMGFKLKACNDHDYDRYYETHTGSSGGYNDLPSDVPPDNHDENHDYQEPSDPNVDPAPTNEAPF